MSAPRVTPKAAPYVPSPGLYALALPPFAATLIAAAVVGRALFGPAPAWTTGTACFLFAGSFGTAMGRGMRPDLAAARYFVVASFTNAGLYLGMLAAARALRLF